MTDTSRPSDGPGAPDVTNVTDAPAGAGAPAARPLFRTAVTALAAARVALGVTALARPSLVARPWVGPAASGIAGQVLGRALGGRDLALGLGTLAAVWGAPPESPAALAWCAAGVLSDVADTAITASAWSELPRITRWLVAGSAAGAAVVGAAGAVGLVFEQNN